MHVLHNANELFVRVRLAFQNFCKLAKRAKTITKYQEQVLVIVWPSHKLTRYRSEQFFFIELFSTKQTQKFTGITSRRADFIHSQREIKEIIDPEKHTFSINSGHKSTWFFFSASVIPCHRCEKSARESRNSHHLIAQRDNIHRRAHDTCVDQRGYMTPGWRNLF